VQCRSVTWADLDLLGTGARGQPPMHGRRVTSFAEVEGGTHGGNGMGTGGGGHCHPFINFIRHAQLMSCMRGVYKRRVAGFGDLRD
jgi:hypothetical protein